MDLANTVWTEEDNRITFIIQTPTLLLKCFKYSNVLWKVTVFKGKKKKTTINLTLKNSSIPNGSKMMYCIIIQKHFSPWNKRKENLNLKDRLSIKIKYKWLTSEEKSLCEGQIAEEELSLVRSYFKALKAQAWMEYN